jgi:hypothetical protein
MMLDCSDLAFPFKVADSEPGASGVTGLDNPPLACGVSVPFKFGVPGLRQKREEFNEPSNGKMRRNKLGH